MDCSICSRAHDAQRLPFLCAVDARNRIYQQRMQHAKLLIEGDGLRSEIAAIQSGPPPQDAEAAASMLHQVEMKTSQVLAAAERLKSEIQIAKDEIQARKVALAKRKSDLASISTSLPARRAKQQDDMEKSSLEIAAKWSDDAESLAGTRSYLCKEALKLYGLRRVKKGGPGRYEYLLGRLPILDVANMDSLPPEVISTSLAHLAHILVVIARYLSIRLPAEVVIPHRDYPKPTIFNLAGSYQHGPVVFPTNKTSHSGNLNDIRSSDSQNAPRPRPLFLEKPLSQLLKDDPAAFSFFLEAVTLLAYDVAWLCRSQGSPIGDKGSMDDVFNMGKNLYSLFVSFSLQLTASPAPPQDLAGDRSEYNRTGRFSHGTMYYFLGGAEGAEFIKSFKLPGPMKLADHLRKRLVPEAPVADWEVLDDDAWKVEDAAGPAVNGGSAKARNNQESNGWMKIKSR